MPVKPKKRISNKTFSFPKKKPRITVSRRKFDSPESKERNLSIAWRKGKKNTPQTEISIERKTFKQKNPDFVSKGKITSVFKTKLQPNKKANSGDFATDQKLLYHREITVKRKRKSKKKK